jgi:hypothetical protein
VPPSPIGEASNARTTPLILARRREKGVRDLAAQTVRDAAEIEGEPARAGARFAWVPGAAEARGGQVPDAAETRDRPVRATKAERRVLTGTLAATLLVLGVLLLALHLELQDYFVQMAPWSY